jgi:hypothetical protein
VTPSSLSLGELVERGAGDLAHYLDRQRVPASPLEWIGIAVTRLPGLTATARTADDVAGRGRSAAAAIRARLLDSLARELGASAGIIDQARARLVERHPDSAGADATAEGYAELVEIAHRSAMRHSEMMIAAYASFLGGAVEAAGSMADAELAAARAQRWNRAEQEQLCELRAGQLHAALSNTLGGLLAYARLLADDAEELSD